MSYHNINDIDDYSNKHSSENGQSSTKNNTFSGEDIDKYDS